MVPTLHLDGDRTVIPARQVPPEVLLRGNDDDHIIRHYMEVKVGQMLVDNIVHFQEYYADCRVNRIPHKYSYESSMETAVVSVIYYS